MSVRATDNGGSSCGTVFNTTLAGVLTTSFAFHCATASNPYALILGTDGNFYGTTLDGGATNAGTIFRLTPGGSFTLLYAFDESGGGGGEPEGIDRKSTRLNSSHLGISYAG